MNSRFLEKHKAANITERNDEMYLSSNKGGMMLKRERGREGASNLTKEVKQGNSVVVIDPKDTKV